MMPPAFSSGSEREPLARAAAEPPADPPGGSATATERGRDQPAEPPDGAVRRVVVHPIRPPVDDTLGSVGGVFRPKGQAARERVGLGAKEEPNGLSVALLGRDVTRRAAIVQSLIDGSPSGE